MFNHDELFCVPGCKTRVLQLSDQAELQALLERCADYCLLVDGYPPEPSAAIELLADCPPGKTPDEMLALGFYTEEHGLIGVLDMLRNYPDNGDWWIGLLLIDPAHRNKGLGRQIYLAFETWARQRDVGRIFLGVVEKNDKAFSFWRSLGFDEVDRQPPRQFGRLTHVVITMRRDLLKGKSP
jgi:GNAT superfamily N-acetyltransferase